MCFPYRLVDIVIYLLKCIVNAAIIPTWFIKEREKVLKRKKQTKQNKQTNLML